MFQMIKKISFILMNNYRSNSICKLCCICISFRKSSFCNVFFIFFKVLCNGSQLADLNVVLDQENIVYNHTVTVTCNKDQGFAGDASTYYCNADGSLVPVENEANCTFGR